MRCTPAVVPIARQVVANDFRRRQLIERRFNGVVANDAIDFGDIKRAVAKRDAIRHVELARENVEPLVAMPLVGSPDTAYSSPLRVPTNSEPYRTQRHGTRSRHLIGIDLELETGRKSNVRDDLFGRLALAYAGAIAKQGD